MTSPLVLFDGTAASMAHWKMVGQGRFDLVEGDMVVQPGHDLGLCYYAARPFADFVLRLQFRLALGDENSGVLVRFRDPRQPVPDRLQPERSYAYDNAAYVAVDTGFEIQIDELARGNRLKGTPGGAAEHHTGVIYDVPVGPAPGQQQCAPGPRLELGAWNEYAIEVRGDTYRVELNGRQTTRFTNADPWRGRSAARDSQSGYVGLQSHTGHVAFRDIRVLPLEG